MNQSLFALLFWVCSPIFSQGIFTSEEIATTPIALYEKGKNSSNSDTARMHYLNEALKTMEEHDTLQSYILYAKCNLHYRLGQIDSLNYFGKKLKRLSEKNENKINLAKYWYLKAYYFENTNPIIDSAYFYYHRAKIVFIESSQPEKAGNCAFRMGAIQRIKNDFFGAKETLIESLKYLQNKNYRASTYNELGIVHRNLNNEENAVKNYQKAIQTTENKRDRLIFRNNLAYDLYFFERYEEAKPIYETILADPVLKKDSISYARTLHNFALLQWKMKISTHEQILQKLNLAKQIRKNTHHTLGILTSYTDIASYYSTKNPTLAKKFADSAIQLGRKMNLPSAEKEALAVLMKLDKNNVSLRDRYVILTDSLHTNELKVKTQFAQMKYEDELEKVKLLHLESEAIQKRAEAAEQKNQKIVFISLSIFLFLGGLALYFLLKQRHKRKELEKVYATERHISKQLHDGLGNDIFGLMTAIQNTYKPPSILDNLEQLYQKTRDLSHSYAAISGGKEFINEIEFLLTPYQNTTTNIILQGHESIAWEMLKDYKCVTIYRALQELLVNMAKHSNASLVFIKFQQQQNNIHVTYKDNGVGGSIHPKKGTGLANTASRIENCNGTFNFNPTLGKGVEVNITIPL
ncbi:tetratricopeptide repeat-containing sensor histidine kinase [Cochleicola gelatinilyticus]|uniref:histidine kinase n=1 Tax=Cochleicola gelatinilyticus TaxID=1763537 RepID=A0A167F0X1_9FLAO|nr:tetratricopeptide repeat-containing sensor histidine kinase [Cochleicola gelatinilyticus]OAB76075.1 hypothetical protein ULVI_13535 [Cochleicola gelatinilyticus]